MEATDDRIIQARELLHRGASTEALNLLQEVVAERGLSACFTEMIIALCGTNRMDEAEVLLRDASENGILHQQVFPARVQFHLSLAEPEEALSIARKWISAHPEAEDAWIVTLQLQHALSLTEQFRKTAESALKHHPDSDALGQLLAPYPPNHVQAEGRDWARQEELLRERLSELGATDAGFRLDLRRGLIYYLQANQTVAVANTYLLAVYNHSARVFQAGWLNSSPDLKAGRPPEVDHVPAQLSEVGPRQALQVVTSMAQRLEQIEYLVNIDTPQLTQFLGLWNLRRPSADEVYDVQSEERARGLAQEHIKALIQRLVDENCSHQELRRHFQASARQLIESSERHFYGSPSGEQLGATGRQIEKLCKHLERPKGCEEILVQLLSHWESANE